jgi:hypothetical protein
VELVRSGGFDRAKPEGSGFVGNDFTLAAIHTSGITGVSST